MEEEFQRTLGPRYNAWVVMGLFAALGFVGLYFATIAPVALMLAESGWQATPCIVVDASVEHVVNTNADNRYGARIRCRYRVGGKDYAAVNLVYADSKFQTDANEEVRRYPAGKDTTCYVNPEQPSEFVLTRDTLEAGPFVLAIVILFGTGMFVWIAWVGRFGGQKKQELSPFR